MAAVSAALRALSREVRISGARDWKQSLAAVAAYLQRLSSTEVLELVGDASLKKRLVPEAWQVDHLGFLARPKALEALPDAARQAGFCRDQRIFESQLMAWRLSSEAAVPTRVFRAGGCFGAQTLAVEVFVPMVWDDQQIDASVARGTGAHIALRAGTMGAFNRGERLLRAAQIATTRYELSQSHIQLRSLWVDTPSQLALQLEHTSSPMSEDHNQ